MWNNLKFSKWPPFWGPRELLNRKLYQKLSTTSNRPCPYLQFELLIDVLAKKLTGLWQWPIFWPRDLVPWPTYLSMLLTGTADPLHMWTKFGDDMSKRPWVMLDKTDRQTDKRTNEHTCQNCKFWQVTDRQTNILAKNCKFWQVMKGQSEIAYLPKFANMMLIVMVIVITEILYIILIFDCFENQ